MGCNFMYRNSTHCEGKKENVKSNNPDPWNYKIINIYSTSNPEIGVVAIRYPDATNFEGKKILVYDRMSVVKERARNKLYLDPHFSEHDLSPVARFAPTEHGARLAIKFAETLAELKL